jgi:starch-binding outer membrane protein, SusD/RagB family
MYKNLIKIILLTLIVASSASCKKFLDAKSNQALATPSSLKDLQALLDNENFYTRGVVLANTMSDEYYLSTVSAWQNAPKYNHDGHIWDAATDDLQDWRLQYGNILYANTVLDYWPKVVEKSSGQEANNIKGAALFLRAHAFFHIAQLFAPQYDPNTASTDPGIVLRLTSDFNTESVRSTVQETYDRIIADLIEAVNLVDNTSAYNTRPNKVAAYALLARTYLQIGDYAKAKEASDKCLVIYSRLIDYNDPTEIISGNFPIVNMDQYNKEIIYLFADQGSLAAGSTNRMAPDLYAFYASDDLRKTTFVRSNMRFKGSYSFGLFIGLSTPEVYLIRAEANARLGNKDAAIADINTLLQKRYKTGTFTDISVATADEALNIVLLQRRKEMAYRGMRWSDLRRLNKEPPRAVTLIRNVDGTDYILPPNDPRYTLLIPQAVISKTNLQQNPR